MAESARLAKEDTTKQEKLRKCVDELRNTLRTRFDELILSTEIGLQDLRKEKREKLSLIQSIDSSNGMSFLLTFSCDKTNLDLVNSAEENRDLITV
jgi:hypothetical protein